VSLTSDVQRIIDRILRNARETAESILSDAQRSAELSIEEQRNKARVDSQGEVAVIMKNGHEEANFTRRAVITDARRKASWMLLSEKARLVNAVLREVEKRLVTVSQSEQSLDALQKSIVRAGTALGGGHLELILSEHDSTLPLDPEVLSNAIHANVGQAVGVTISSERIPSTGGYVIRTSDGKIVIDNTFPAILRRRDRALRHRIAQILFPKS
jgi:vacuolar-type H+-ATPase subunit E/Vma4